MSPIEKFIIELVDSAISTRVDLQKFQRRFSKTNKVQFFTNDELLSTYHKLLKKNIISTKSNISSLLRLKSTRSDSGIVVVSVLSKPYDCPGQCIYCPTEPGVPKSYLAKEPAVMRAIDCQYNPYKQITSRISALKNVGHLTEKTSIRIIGGTWSYYPKSYRTWFVKELFRGANEVIFKGTLDWQQRQNETSNNRIVELSVETRQDYIDLDEIRYLRKLGVTKVELGVQSTIDRVLEFNNRGNTDRQTIDATKLLKDAGFKVSYQMMLNLPSSNMTTDVENFNKLFQTSPYQPDHLKIYPLALLKNTVLYNKLYKTGKFIPYDSNELTELLVTIKKIIPPYCRIERVIRDIPAEAIVEGGAKVSNLRQIVLQKMKDEDSQCQCIRCREIKNQYNPETQTKLFRLDYDASGGKEIFLSIESPDRKQLFSLLRLRIPSFIFQETKHLKVLSHSAIIRELHTYGPEVSIGKIDASAVQHRGYGKRLVRLAENITKEEFGIPKISVIAGVGVRGYFHSLGYELCETYMQKNLI